MNTNNELAKYRVKVDGINNEIKYLLIKRFDLLNDILKIKNKLNISLYDKERESNIYTKLNETKSVYSKEIISIFKCILDESKTYLKKNQLE